MAAPEEMAKTVSYFSSGIDGAYTFLRNENAIDLLLLAKGIANWFSSDEAFADALQKNNEYS